MYGREVICLAGEAVSREKVLEELQKLAFGNCGDVVKLAFWKDADVSRLGKLDLRALAGLHSAANGGVELRLIDRARLIELLLEATAEQAGAGDAVGGLISAMNGAANRLSAGAAQYERDAPPGGWETPEAET
ncbi:MAG: hypothetical protein LIO54_04690 [Oscillospiraceae bacterium]|nr:hypothetical protein [Oscillospiraceae bacterium]